MDFRAKVNTKRDAKRRQFTCNIAGTLQGKEVMSIVAIRMGTAKALNHQQRLVQPRCQVACRVERRVLVGAKRVVHPVQNEATVSHGTVGQRANALTKMAGQRIEHRF